MSGCQVIVPGLKPLAAGALPTCTTGAVVGVLQP